MPRLWAGAATAILVAFHPGASPAQSGSGAGQPIESLPEVEIIAAAPLAASGIDRNKVPAPGWSIDSVQLRAAGPASLTGTLERLVPGIAVNDVSGSPFQPDLQFRGFAASAVLGTPAGIAVYQNGARINEAFGDTVNWNLVPDFAVRRADLLTADPVFGLNALGGALALEMKNGFNFQQNRLELAGGSFARGEATFEQGIQSGALASYIGGHLANDGGYRQQSSARIGQLYGDLGAETDQVALHVSFTGSADAIHAVGPTPVELLASDRSAVFTFPQGNRNKLAFVTGTGKVKTSDTLAIDVRSVACSEPPNPVARVTLRSISPSVVPGRTSGIGVPPVENSRSRSGNSRHSSPGANPASQRLASVVLPSETRCSKRRK